MKHAETGKTASKYPEYYWVLLDQMQTSTASLISAISTSQLLKRDFFYLHIKNPTWQWKKHPTLPVSHPNMQQL